MSLHATNNQALQLAEIVNDVRTREYIHISFYCLYVYYVLATLPEEISIIIPHKRNLGKGLFFLIRYGMCMYIALHFIREYRTYHIISPQSCKALGITQHFVYWLVDLSCSLSLGLCLGALLRASWLCVFPISFLCVAPPLIDIVYTMGNDLRYPTKPVSPPAAKLGYPCFIPSDEEWSQVSTSQIGNDVRAYVRLTATIILLVVTIIVFFVEYRRHKGRLIRVIRRDVGLCYLAVTGVRVLSAILNAPAISTAQRSRKAYTPIPLYAPSRSM